MAQCSESNHINDTVSCQSLTNTQLLITSTGETPILPFDLIQEILCRLPVKFLLQLRCICKSWKSLTSHPKFVKKHLRISKTSQHTHHLLVSAINNLQELVLWDYPIPYASIPNIITQTQIEFPTGNLKCTDNICLAVCSCDGILCFTTVSGGESAILWNPSIRRFKILPPLKFSSFGPCSYSFGYDCFFDNYKVVAVSFFANFLKVNVHTLGTDYWRMTHDIPYSEVIRQPGVIVNGSVHWLVCDVFWSIVSLDLEKDSYGNLLLPDKVVIDGSTLGLLRDCLCIFTESSEFYDVWVLKDYENQESWTELYHIPCREYTDIDPNNKAIYVSEDEQVLMYFRKFMELTLAVYDSKNDTLNIPMFPDICPWLGPEVYVESLISPCS